MRLLYNVIFLAAIVGFAIAQENEENDEKFEREQVDKNKLSEEKCRNKKCEDGSICEDGECKCIDECIAQWNSYDRTICVEGHSYRHECDFWRNKCYCSKNDPRCGGEEFNSHQVNEAAVIRHYGECQDFSQICNWELHKETFAERFESWLRAVFNLKWSAAKNEEDDSLLRPIYSQVRSNAGNIINGNSNNGSVSIPLLSFWFCEIDFNKDKSLDQAELARLFRVLLPSEPCLTIFIETCSSGGSSKLISGDNWLKCFNTEGSVDCRDFSPK